MKVYSDYTQEELNRQYNQQALVPNMLEYIGQNQERSEAIRQRLQCELDIPYGPALDERLDIFPAEQRGAPIQIYHHGGAWTSTSKKNYSYIASSFHIKGITLIIPDFSLAPKVTLDEMVRQNRAAIAWTFHNAETFGGDNSRIYISGHSSGGHLAGMMLITDWEKEHGLPKDLIKGATLCSGIYDLEPVRLSHRNEYLFLDEHSAFRNSPIHHIPPVHTPLVIGCGEREHDEFKRQSDAFSEKWERAGNPVTKIHMKGQNHFDVERELANVYSSIMKTTWAIMGRL